MSLDDLVFSTITTNTSAPTRKGFGMPMLLAYHTHYNDLVRTYSKASDMLSDGFTTTEHAYLAAQVLKSQKPCPPKFKVGRRANKQTQTIKLKCAAAPAGGYFTIGTLGNQTAISVGVATGSTSAQCATALAAAIVGGGVSTSVTSDTVTCTAGSTTTSATFTMPAVNSSATATVASTVSNYVGQLVTLAGAGTLKVAAVTDATHLSLTNTGAAGNASATTAITSPAAVTNAAGLFDVKNWSSNISFSDATADPGIAADIAAIDAADDDWYGLAPVYCPPSEATALAAWAESNGKIFPINCSDSACADPASTTDLMYTLKSLNYGRSGVLYCGNQLLSFGAIGWMAGRFVAAPGSDTWDGKTIVGVVTDVLSETQYGAIKAKNGNLYNTVAGEDITDGGKCAGGEWFDVVRGLDWLNNNIQINVFSLKVNNPKIPFTALGIDMVQTAVQSALTAATKAGVLVDGSTSVTVPDISDVSATDRNNRTLTGVTWEGLLEGAIQIVNPISGTVS